jgi:hypothetical protein
VNLAGYARLKQLSARKLSFGPPLRIRNFWRCGREITEAKNKDYMAEIERRLNPNEEGPSASTSDGKMS